MKKKIGIVGFNNTTKRKLEKKYKNFNFCKINKKDLNLYLKKNLFFGVAIDNTGNFCMGKKLFFNKNNLIITNHQAGLIDNTSRRKELSISNLNRFYKNVQLKNLVSKELEY